MGIFICCTCQAILVASIISSLIQQSPIVAGRGGIRCSMTPQSDEPHDDVLFIDRRVSLDTENHDTYSSTDASMPVRMTLRLMSRRCYYHALVNWKCNFGRPSGKQCRRPRGGHVIALATSSIAVLIRRVDDTTHIDVLRG